MFSHRTSSVGIRASLPAVALLIVTTVVSGSVAPRTQVDARRKLREAQQELQRYLADEREYEARTSEHLRDVKKQLWDALRNLGISVVFDDGVARALRDLYDVNATVSATDSNTIAEVAARNSLGRWLDQVVDEILDELPRRSGWRSVVPALGEIPDLVDLVFDYLYFKEDLRQRDSLDAQREAALKAVDYWSRRVRNETANELPRASSAPLPPDTGVQRRMQRLRIRVMTPGDAVRQGAAELVGVAREGYSRTDLRIVSTADDYLALDFSGAYLIPAGGGSNSQRLGLVSAYDRNSLGQGRHGYSRRFGVGLDSAISRIEGVSGGRLHQAKLASTFHEPPTEKPALGTILDPTTIDRFAVADRNTAAWSRGHWVIIGPRSTVTIPFHTVCLDRGRATPSQGERFYVSDRPLPARIQRILLAGSMARDVPQSKVWETVQAENIKWYDPRDNVGTVEIRFIGDSSTYGRDGTPIQLGATVWIDGRVIIDAMTVRDQAFSTTVQSGRHTLQILPRSSVGRLEEASRIKTVVDIVKDQTTRYKATLRMRSYPYATVLVDSFTKL